MALCFDLLQFLNKLALFSLITASFVLPSTQLVGVYGQRRTLFLWCTYVKTNVPQLEKFSAVLFVVRCLLRDDLAAVQF